MSTSIFFTLTSRLVTRSGIVPSPSRSASRGMGSISAPSSGSPLHPMTIAITITMIRIRNLIFQLPCFGESVVHSLTQPP